MKLSKKQTTKVLIRLRRCAGWSAPVLLATPRRQGFSGQTPHGVRDPFLGNMNRRMKSHMHPLQNNQAFSDQWIFP